jgi:hypothetical protein
MDVSDFLPSALPLMSLAKNRSKVGSRLSALAEAAHRLAIGEEEVLRLDRIAGAACQRIVKGLRHGQMPVVRSLRQERDYFSSMLGHRIGSYFAFSMKLPAMQPRGLTFHAPTIASGGTASKGEK